MHFHVLGLPNTVHTVNGLVVQCRVPPYVEEDDPFLSNTPCQFVTKNHHNNVAPLSETFLSPITPKFPSLTYQTFAIQTYLLATFKLRPNAPHLVDTIMTVVRGSVLSAVRAAVRLLTFIEPSYCTDLTEDVSTVNMMTPASVVTWHQTQKHTSAHPDELVSRALQRRLDQIQL